MKTVDKLLILLLLIGMTACASVRTPPRGSRPFEQPKGYPLPVTGREVFPGSGSVPQAYARFEDAGVQGMMYFLVSGQAWCLVSAGVYTMWNDRDFLTCNWRQPRGQYR
jgi:hypothetical protein